jgi:deoxyribodipyrimidine photolyase-related protein
MKTHIILPTQLFKNNELVDVCDIIYLIEEPYYFTRFNFHKQKLVLHRASMQFYKDYLKKYNVKYIPFNKVNNNFYKSINNKSSEIHIYDPVDKPIIKMFNKFFKNKLHICDTPAFMETNEELDNYRNKNTNKKHYYHDISFYRWQRKRLNILMDKDKPLYSKWSFDKENRNPFSNDYNEIKIKTYNNKYIKEAIDYILDNFKNNFGDINNFYYPVTFKEAELHFSKFIKYKLKTFGEFEDAVDTDIIFGSHSNISCLLNIGLLTPDYVIDKVLNIFEKSNDKKKLINSVEAFIRQIIGWRSYMRFIYIYHSDDMENDNYLNHTNKLSKNWYDATTNIPIIDALINKANKYAYLHHIERLMYMSNFGLICMIDPNDIFEWFMICFIDSYDWVMYANVYGMGQYASTFFTTRPYFSSTNYIKKMSNFKDEIIIINNKEYSQFDIWNGLYYNFINTHKDKLKKIYAVAPLVRHLTNMSESNKKTNIDNAKIYLKYY